MGNRAVITNATYDTNGDVIEKVDETQVGVYLHWNGGYDSVDAFLRYCELKGYRPTNVDHYGWARLCQVIGNFFGGGLSLGIDICKHLDCDNYDNGVYLIKDWRIVGRVYYKGREQHAYDLKEMLFEINSRQPEDERLTDDDINNYIEKLVKGEV